jgi:acyl-CoA thioester hydrolase
MSAVFHWPHVVGTDEADELGHANNEMYLRWMNAAALAHSAALGWPRERYFALGEGWVVRRHEMDYLRPARPGMAIVVRTCVRSFDKASSWRAYAVVNQADHAVLARGKTLWVWINYKTGRLGRIPPDVGAAFPVVSETEEALGSLASGA